MIISCDGSLQVLIFNYCQTKVHAKEARRRYYIIEVAGGRHWFCYRLR